MKHDDAEFYFIDFPPDIAQERGGRHIALFLAWAITRGLGSAALCAHGDALRAGTLDPVDLLMEECDGKLTSEDLAPEGDAFATACYARVPASLAQAMRLDDADDERFFRRELSAQEAWTFMHRLDVLYADWRVGSGRGLPAGGTMRQGLHDALAPLLMAAGFVQQGEADADEQRHIVTFASACPGGQRVVRLCTWPWGFGFHGIGIDAYLDLPAFHDHVVAEKNIDLGWYSGLQPSVDVPFERIAEGWPGPTAYGMRFWVFDDVQLAALLAHLVDRMNRVVLPVLRSLDGVDAIALACGTRPMSESVLYRPHDPYPALLAAELVRHPRLRAMLDEAEATIQAKPDDARTPDAQGALALIHRIRERSPAV